MSIDEDIATVREADIYAFDALTHRLADEVDSLRLALGVHTRTVTDLRAQLERAEYVIGKQAHRADEAEAKLAAQEPLVAAARGIANWAEQTAQYAGTPKSMPGFVALAAALVRADAATTLPWVQGEPETAAVCERCKGTGWVVGELCTECDCKQRADSVPTETPLATHGFIAYPGDPRCQVRNVEEWGHPLCGLPASHPVHEEGGATDA